MRYRAGALRGPRSLRDVYTGFALSLPMVGTKILQATNGSQTRRGYTSYEVTAPRVVGPAGRP
jgi:hypothetical protein